MRVPLAAGLLALVLALAAGGAGAAAEAVVRTTRGPCFPGASGPPCQFETGTVTDVNDGDTVSVHLDGDRPGRSYAVRFRAVQAMELHRYSRFASRRTGECHAVEAANRVDRLVRAAHGRVRLSTQVPSSDRLGRLQRWIAVRLNGRWADLGEILMRTGDTIWMDNTADTAWNRRYDLLGQQAAQAHRGMWDTTHCGVGPQQELPIRVWANWDPPGIDTPEGEWVKVQNRGAAETLHLGGWWVRDAMLRRFTFPPGTSVGPGETATVHVGRGPTGPREFAWGLTDTIFENAGDARDLGDGAYLFDPQGDLRAWMLYPCLVACSDPLQGAFTVTAQPRRPERLAVTNRTAAPVDLYGLALMSPAGTYPFPEGTRLDAGATLTVFMQGDPADDAPGVRHWGLSSNAVLPDAGGSARVATFSDITLACTAWGSGRCG